MYQRSGFLSRAYGGISDFVVYALPRAEGCAHGRSYKQHRTLSTNSGQSLLPFLRIVEVPWHAVVLVNRGQVEGKAWHKSQLRKQFDGGRRAGRRVDLTHNSLKSRIPLTTITTNIPGHRTHNRQYFIINALNFCAQASGHVPK